jgi:hypothetical protein
MSTLERETSETRSKVLIFTAGHQNTTGEKSLNNYKNADDDIRHQLWLIYSQLKDAESDPGQRLELLEHSREELGKVLNKMNRQTSFLLISVNHELKSPSSKAANSNCRDRQFNLTPDSHRS